MLVSSTGGAAPNLPIVTSTIPRSTSIAITWIVQTISYTAESYNIEYGFENNSLTASGERVNGSQNLTSLNIIYSSTLYDLQPYTLYYYRIVAENSFSTSQISVATFRTTESGTVSLAKMKDFFVILYDLHEYFCNLITNA